MRPSPSQLLCAMLLPSVRGDKCPWAQPSPASLPPSFTWYHTWSPESFFPLAWPSFLSEVPGAEMDISKLFSCSLSTPSRGHFPVTAIAGIFPPTASLQPAPEDPLWAQSHVPQAEGSHPRCPLAGCHSQVPSCDLRGCVCDSSAAHLSRRMSGDPRWRSWGGLCRGEGNPGPCSGSSALQGFPGAQ